MQNLEVSGAVRPLKWSLGVKWLIFCPYGSRSFVYNIGTAVPDCMPPATCKKTLGEVSQDAGISSSTEDSSKGVCHVSLWCMLLGN